MAGETLNVNIDEYIELYNKGIPLSAIKPLDNQTYKIFRASNVDVRIIRREQTYDNPNALLKIRHFINNNKNFYMIPVTTINGTIVGFIVRGVFKSDYATVSREFDDISKRVPLLFGFDEKFKNFENHRTCPPIVVCEGSKDCLFLKHYYPYVVAVNTSSMGLSSQVLINLTNKFILAYDNDSAGQEGIERDKKILRGLGAQVVSLELDKSVKDCADYIKYPEKIKALKEELHYKFDRVNSF